jgi:hypothetical protein
MAASVLQTRGMGGWTVFTKMVTILPLGLRVRTAKAVSCSALDPLSLSGLVSSLCDKASGSSIRMGHCADPGSDSVSPSSQFISTRIGFSGDPSLKDIVVLPCPSLLPPKSSTVGESDACHLLTRNLIHCQISSVDQAETGSEGKALKRCRSEIAGGSGLSLFWQRACDSEGEEDTLCTRPTTTKGVARSLCCLTLPCTHFPPSLGRMQPVPRSMLVNFRAAIHDPRRFGQGAVRRQRSFARLSALQGR